MSGVCAVDNPFRAEQVNMEHVFSYSGYTWSSEKRMKTGSSLPQADFHKGKFNLARRRL
jgi:hypothetical protein